VRARKGVEAADVQRPLSHTSLPFLAPRYAARRAGRRRRHPAYSTTAAQSVCQPCAVMRSDLCSSPSMNPSEYEIQREVETLRDIKRRSSAQGGPGALLIDPDLPEQSATAPHANYWVADGDEEGASSEDAGDQVLSPANEDPASLFWVPARLHPEIAPSEFSAFLKEHARVATDGSAAGLTRAASGSSMSGLGRKKSMLRNQYRPTANDGVEDEAVKPLRRNQSIAYSNVPQLTISDLQKLEELAEEASKSDDPSKLRSVLRRSMSMSVAPSGAWRMFCVFLRLTRPQHVSYRQDGQSSIR
jgi:hypothetical protein